MLKFLIFLRLIIAYDFNFCRMVNKKVVDTESVNDINVNNNDPLDINS